MTTVERSGVQFDMCPTCRGVWLDRGELEKLMEDARGGAAAPQRAPSQDSYRDNDRRYERERYRDDDDDHRRYRKPRSIFDIFD